MALFAVISLINFNTYLNKQAEENKKFDKAKFSVIETDTTSLKSALEENNQADFELTKYCRQASVKFQEGTIYCAISLENEWGSTKTAALNNKIKALAQLISASGYFFETNQGSGTLGVSETSESSQSKYRSFGYKHKNTGASCSLHIERQNNANNLSVDFFCSADAKEQFYPWFDPSALSH